MVFSEKLNFLFELSHAEGKELAAAMNITPPQISKMRRGVRGLPRNSDSAELIARFFAQRCRTEFQREALSKAIRVSHIRDISDENALTDILLDWLSDDRDPDVYAAKRADDFLRRFGTLLDSDDTYPFENEQSRVLSSGASSFIAYYGGEGKRLAVMSFLNYVFQRKAAYRIDILTDESIAWVTDEPNYSKQLQSTMVKLAEQGCTFRRISGPIADVNQAFESLNRWFSLYMTGKATSYYYKRMRDNLNRVTLFVVPDVAALFSFSIGNIPQKNSVTFFTVDAKTISSMSKEFENYLDLCDPIMNVYSMEKSPNDLHYCMVTYESYQASCIQRSDSLSVITLPWDVAISLEANSNIEDKSGFLSSFAQRYKKFKANLSQYTFVDIIRLANAQDVANGRVQIPAACVLGRERQCYTASNYIQHLRSILFLLEHEKNYHVVLREPEDTDSTIIYVKEGHCALLTRDVAPFSLYEVSERYLVDAFTEYLRRQITNEQDMSIYRHSVISKIKMLISEIENVMTCEIS